MTQGDCEQTILRTWTAMDDCGNMAMVSQTIIALEDCEDCMLPIVENVTVNPTICDQSTGTASIDLMGNESDYTFTWIPDFGTPTSIIDNARNDLPTGDYIVIMNYQGQADCEDKVELTIEDDCTTPPSPRILMSDFEIISYKCESANPVYCLDIPFSEINNYTITVNEEEFDDYSFGCGFEQTYAYSLGNLGGIGNTDEFIVDSWIVDDQDYQTTFDNITILVDFMNAKDPEGFWRLDENTATIKGEVTGKTYGTMKIRHAPTGIIWILMLNTTTYAIGIELNLPAEESHQIVVTRNIDQIKDTLELITTCVTTDTIYHELELGETVEICLSMEGIIWNHEKYEA